MPDRVFFDTNVLLYTVMQNDSRHERALQLMGAGGVISVQVLNEFVAVVRRKVQMPWKDVEKALGWLRVLCPAPLPISVNTHEKALEIAARYGYQIYDSLVIASALEGECNVLYSEDLQDRHVIEQTLTLCNPFQL